MNKLALAVLGLTVMLSSTASMAFTTTRPLKGETPTKVTPLKAPAARATPLKATAQPSRPHVVRAVDASQMTVKIDNTEYEMLGTAKVFIGKQKAASLNDVPVGATVTFVAVPKAPRPTLRALYVNVESKNGKAGGTR